MRSILTISSVLAGIVFALPVAAAEIAVTGPDILAPGGDGIFAVTLTTDDELVNAVAGVLHVPSDLVTVKTFTHGDSLITLWVEPPTVVNNTIRFSGITPGGIPLTTGPLFDVVLQGEQTGTGQLSFGETVLLENDGAGTQVPVVATTHTITVDPAAERSVYATDDALPPEPFTITATRDDTLFDGKRVAVFGTQDKGSGIAYYEIQETLSRHPDETHWRRVTSPALLEHQGGRHYLFVKAVDRAGNVRIAHLPPERPVGYSALVLIVLLGIGYGFYRRFRSRA